MLGYGLCCHHKVRHGERGTRGDRGWFRMRGPMAAVRRKYGLEFKKDAVARMMVCEDVKALALELGIRRKFLYKWRDQLGAKETMPVRKRFGEQAEPVMSAAVSAERIAELERLLGRKQLELDFFKQAFDHVRGIAVKSTSDGATPSIAASTRLARSKED